MVKVGDITVLSVVFFKKVNPVFKIMCCVCYI